MLDKIIGDAYSRTMGELVITSLDQVKIFAAITDKAIAGLDAGIDGDYSGVICVINYTFIKYQFGIGVCSWILDADGLVAVKDHCVIKNIVYATSQEINAWP